VEWVQTELGVLTASGDHERDPFGRIGADQGDLRATLGTQAVEELLQRLPIPAGVGPQQDTGVVVNDHSEVLVAALVTDLVDPDPAQVREPVGVGLGVGDHPGHDRADGAPGDPQQVADRGLRAVRHQPGSGVIEGVGVAGAVPCPGHLGGDDSVLGAAHPRRVSLQERLGRAEVQRPPTAAALTLVIAGAALPAASTPSLGRFPGSHRDHHGLLVLVELDAFHDGLAQPQQLSPYPCRTHAVPLHLRFQP